MKHLLALISVFTLALLLSSCTDQVTDIYSSATDDQMKEAVLAPVDLSEDEIAGLLYMREEEKVARDVYNVLGAKWHEDLFTRIAGSEQNHMDAVKKMIDKYELTDPVDEIETPGLFTEAFQKIYDDLVALGLSSKENAIVVGQIIEQTDIDDLDKWIGLTNAQEIIKMYEHLKAGSERHLISFTNHITTAL